MANEEIRHEEFISEMPTAPLLEPGTPCETELSWAEGEHELELGVSLAAFIAATEEVDYYETPGVLRAPR